MGGRFSASILSGRLVSLSLQWLCHDLVRFACLLHHGLRFTYWTFPLYCHPSFNTVNLLPHPRGYRDVRQQIDGPMILVGHDIGLMVAYAYAQAYRDDVSHLVIMDAPLPGTDVFDRLRSNPRLWHFAFHNAIDVAEMLVAGRERQYLQTFFNVRNFDPSAVDLETYVSAYSAPGAMRAGFELYRAFDRDAEDNREALRRNGKLTIPLLAVAGTISNSGPLLEEMMREVADNVTALRVPATAHWIAEEGPQALTSALLEFLRS